MELKWLEYFVVSVDAGSLSKAAEILYTTQPNVSKIIKELEDSLGVLLLERGRRGVVMTEEGQQIYKYARQMLECRENISDTLRRSRRALLKTARRLLRRASDYLESHAAQFPLYDPQANVLNRCSIDGKLVQTR